MSELYSAWRERSNPTLQSGATPLDKLNAKRAGRAEPVVPERARLEVFERMIHEYAGIKTAQMMMEETHD